MKGRGQAEPIPLAMVWDLLAKAIMGKGDVIVREEKNIYYQKYDQWLHNQESRV